MLLNDGLRLLCLHTLLLGNVVCWEGTKGHDYFTSTPIIGTNLEPGTCQTVVIKGFLKERCFIGGKMLFKCPFSNNYYRVLSERCSEQKFSKVCENDPSFYQSCGHLTCPHTLQELSPRLGVCGDIVCESLIDGGPPATGWDQQKTSIIHNVELNLFKELIVCDGKVGCLNTVNNINVDERGCNDGLDYFKCSPFLPENEQFTTVPLSKKCNDVCDCSEHCFDEANCYNRSVGLMCRRRSFSTSAIVTAYLHPQFICDTKRHCINGIDEKNCLTNETCDSPSFSLFLSNKSRQLNHRNKCSVPANVYRRSSMVCSDFKDQMNCTNVMLSPLSCKIGGYLTTISKYVICKGIGLCDDLIDDKCLDVDYSCKVHRHRLCDGVPDCDHGADEGSHYCKDLVSINCVRKLSYGKLSLPFPRQWVLDGVEDCLDGIDEDYSRWKKKCGAGNEKIFILNNDSSSCSNVPLLKCPSSHEYLLMPNICQKKSNCDLLICKASRRLFYQKIEQSSSKKSFIRNFFCSKGLSSLERMIGPCKQFDFKMIRSTAIGVNDSYRMLSNIDFARKLDCREIFGQLYISLVCLGQCQQPGTCPLHSVPFSSCINFSKEQRIFAITREKNLTIVKQEKDGTFHQDFYSCLNDRCISLDRVCDLIDDCGDASDETDCVNNFRCNSGEFIALTRKCDGRFDCLDFSDECNSHCDNQVKIFNHFALYIAAWVTGCISVALNGCVIKKKVKDFLKQKTSVAKVNNCFMIVISIGDILQGLFLVLVALADKFLNDSTCFTQFKWTTSNTCNFLGIISTAGSIISLISMMNLSVIRAYGTRSLLVPSEEMSVRKKFYLVTKIVCIFIVSITIALVPLIPVAEDFFVRSLSYENNLFVGKAGIPEHEGIIKAYFGRIMMSNPTWKMIRKLVEDMFVNGKVEGKIIGFYGSNGFCLFNYFLKDDNPQKWFVGSVVVLNFACVLVILGSYIIVNLSTRQSSSLAGPENKGILKRNATIQRKISVLIATDIVTWIPFLFMVVLHFYDVVDASSWHSLFSIIVLPCNSIINPILILEEEIIKFFGKVWSGTKALKYGQGSG